MPPEPTYPPCAETIWATLPDDVRSAFARVEAVVLDADGVLTDGRITVSSDGTESMTFHVRDGSGTWMLHKSGLKVGVITGRDTGILERGNGGFKLDRIIAGSRMKDAALLEMLADWGIPPQNAVFVGDDLLDAPALRVAGVSVCVADAAPEIRELCTYVTLRGGGQGAVREVAELVLEARQLRAGLVAQFVDRPLANEEQDR